VAATSIAAGKAYRDLDLSAEMAGSNFDLDADLESAGIEHLLKTGKEPK
jgi:hypothetical protein